MFPKICSNNLSTKNSGKILPNSEETFYAKKNRKISTQKFSTDMSLPKTWSTIYTKEISERKSLPKNMKKTIFHKNLWGETSTIFWTETGEDFLPWKVLASCCCSTKKNPFLFVETWWDQNDFQSQDSGETKASSKPWMINVGLLIFGVSSSGSKTQRPPEKDSVICCHWAMIRI